MGGAVSDEDRYTDKLIALPFQPKGYDSAWCIDALLWRHMATGPELGAVLLYVFSAFLCVCVRVCVVGWWHVTQL